MATLYRSSDGDSVQVYVLDAGIEHPAEVHRHPVESGVPVEDHRETLARQYTVGAIVPDSLGPQGVLEYLDWIRASQAEGLRLVLDDGRESDTLTLGTWSEAITRDGRRLSLSLSERLVATVRGDTVRVQKPVAKAPADSQKAGASETEDTGRGATTERSASALISLFGG